MKYSLILICLLGLLISCGSQRVKGSRIVITEQTPLKDFTAIEIKGSFVVGIRKGREAIMKVTADDNLHSEIQAEVSNNTLYIQPKKRIIGSQSLKILLDFPHSLDRIRIAEDVELYAEEDLFLEDLDLQIDGKAKAGLTLTASRVRIYLNDRSRTELHLKAAEVFLQLNHSSNLEALVYAPDIKVDMYEKASARIEGETNLLSLRSDHSSRFQGSKLTADKAKITAEGRSESQVEVREQLELTGRHQSQVEVYGTPRIELQEFSGTTRLFKKEH